MTTPKLPKKTLASLVFTLFLFSFICGVSAQGTVVNAQSSTLQPAVGSTLTVAITVSNVQNLAGIDTTLTWDPTVLTLQNSVLNLGVEIHSNGVLHGTTIKTDVNSLNAGDIYAQETKVQGSYELVSTESGSTTQAFSGSGTIVTLTFNVVKTGSAALNLQTDLSDFPVNGQPANLINHQDSADTVNAVAQGTSTSPSTSASVSPTTSVSSSPTTSPSVPEYQTPAIIAAIIALTTATAVLSIKKRIKTQ